MTNQEMSDYADAEVIRAKRKERPDWLKKAAQRFGGRRMCPEEKTIHVTELLQPPHMVRLKDRYHDALVQDPMDMVPAIVGIAFHEYVHELMHGEGGIGEETHLRRIGEWAIIGTPDWHDDTTIRDYKTTRMWSKVFGKREWEEQLNLYAWLLAEDFPRIDTLEIHAVYLDWSRAMVDRNPDLPRERVEVLPVNVWHFSDTENFIRKRLQALENWEGVCTPEERWERDEHWAVMKPGRKRALKRCSSQQEAMDIVEKVPSTFVEYRPGTPTRCLSYCPVRHKCSFGRGLVELSDGVWWSWKNEQGI